MLRLIRSALRWWQESRQWKQEHLAAFSIASTLDENGLTAFQNQCFTAVSKFCPISSFELIKPVKDTPYLKASISRTEQILFIYDVEAGIQDGSSFKLFEEWHFKLPEDLIGAVKSALENLKPSA